MEERTQLVKKGDLNQVLATLLLKEKEIIEQVKILLPHVTMEGIKSSLERKLAKSENCVVALEQGYVPVDGWFTRVDTKQRWGKRRVEEALKTMPEEVKEAWQKADALGAFESFSITGGDGGDPMFVGNAGGKHFLIAAWVNLPGGNAIGFRVR